METTRLILCLLALSPIAASLVNAQHMVPFKGHWTGITVSADLTNFPVAAVVSEGSGPVTHLGNTFMSSPHTSNVFTGETIGQQIFTAANGDQLIAHCEGFALPEPDQPQGPVTGSLDCEFTSGTGRFEGATGSYVFVLVATPQPGVFPPIYETEAEISGSISSVGSSH
jgi:hypothetical protein